MKILALSSAALASLLTTTSAIPQEPAMATMILPPSSCVGIKIEGLQKKWMRSRCAESRARVTSIPHPARDHRPSCLGSSERMADAVEISQNLQDLGTFADALGGAVSISGGMILGAVVGQIANTVAADIIKHNTRYKNSHCEVACVHLPVDAQEISVVGWAEAPLSRINPLRAWTPDNLKPRTYGTCTVRSAGGLCRSGWAAMDRYTSATNEKGRLFCSVAKNWLAQSPPREFALRIYYN